MGVDRESMAGRSGWREYGWREWQVRVGLLQGFIQGKCVGGYPPLTYFTMNTKMFI